MLMALSLCCASDGATRPGPRPAGTATTAVPARSRRRPGQMYQSV
jgi:hypothetical protein